MPLNETSTGENEEHFPKRRRINQINSVTVDHQPQKFYKSQTFTFRTYTYS